MKKRIALIMIFSMLAISACTFCGCGNKSAVTADDFTISYTYFPGIYASSNMVRVIVTPKTDLKDVSYTIEVLSSSKTVLIRQAGNPGNMTKGIGSMYPITGASTSQTASIRLTDISGKRA